MSYVDMVEIRQQWAPLSLTADSAGKWVARFLTMWLIKDHGLVNVRGHGFPSAPGYEQLPEDPRKVRDAFATIPRANLDEIISYNPHAFPTTRAPKGLFGLPQPIVIMFQFLHTPYDGVLIVMEQKGQTWKIVRLYWVVA
jgi:hypothetical protein